jgi:hypothetical protein
MRKMLPERMTDITGYPLSEMTPMRKAERIYGQMLGRMLWRTLGRTGGFLKKLSNLQTTDARNAK